MRSVHQHRHDPPDGRDDLRWADHQQPPVGAPGPDLNQGGNSNFRNNGTIRKTPAPAPRSSTARSTAPTRPSRSSRASSARRPERLDRRRADRRRARRDLPPQRNEDAAGRPRLRHAHRQRRRPHRARQRRLDAAAPRSTSPPAAWRAPGAPTRTNTGEITFDGAIAELGLQQLRHGPPDGRHHLRRDHQHRHLGHHRRPPRSPAATASSATTTARAQDAAPAPPRSTATSTAPTRPSRPSRACCCSPIRASGPTARVNADKDAIFRFKRNEECCWTMSPSGTLTGSGAGKVEQVNGAFNGGTLNFPPATSPAPAASTASPTAARSR